MISYRAFPYVNANSAHLMAGHWVLGFAEYMASETKYV